MWSLRSITTSIASRGSSRSTIPSVSRSIYRNASSLPEVKLSSPSLFTQSQRSLTSHSASSPSFSVFNSPFSLSAAQFSTSTTPKTTKDSGKEQGEDKKQEKKHGSNNFFKGVAATTAILSSIYIYNHYIDPYVEEPELQYEVVPSPAEAFIHPLNNSSFLYRWYFYVARMSYLIYSFLPMVGLSIKHFVTPDYPEKRQEMLQCLVSCIEKAGCAFIKFGQWLSMRPDMFSLDVITTLSQLRDNAPSHSYAATREIIESEFGATVEEVFDSFKQDPIASGSIAQVYKAVLSEKYAQIANMRDSKGGLIREVAVKVRHPNVLNETWLDVDLIYFTVSLIPQLCLPFSKEEFRNMMQNQVDFRWEAYFLSRFAHNFMEEIKQGYLNFPLVSARMLKQSVLVESWATGQTVSDIFTEVGELFLPLNQAQIASKHIDLTQEDLGSYIKTRLKYATTFISDELSDIGYSMGTFLGLDMKKWGLVQYRPGEDKYVYDNNLSKEENELMAKKQCLAFTLFDTFLKMFLRDNLIHADLHAGNVLFNTSNNTATILDTGMTVSLDDDVMKQFGYFLKSICEGDDVTLVEQIADFEVNIPTLPKGSGKGILATDPVKKAAFAQEIHAIFEKFYKKSAYGSTGVRAENVSIGDVVGQILITMQHHDVILRGDVATSIMAMSCVEGTLRSLSNLDIIIKSLPYFIRYKGFSNGFM